MRVSHMPAKSGRRLTPRSTSGSDHAVRLGLLVSRGPIPFQTAMVTDPIGARESGCTR